MSGTLDFYFDFSSPYAYLAAQSVDAIASKHEHIVAWRPIRLGTIFRALGITPHVTIAPKWAYVARDLARGARCMQDRLARNSSFKRTMEARGKAYTEDNPIPFGPGRIWWRSLVAITTSSRSAKSLSARPRISSLEP